MCRLLASIVLICALVVGNPVASYADVVAPETSGAPELAGELIGPGADATVVISEDDIDEARDLTTSDAAAELTPAERHAEDLLLEASEDAGGSLDAEAIDVLTLAEGDVVLAVPATLEVNKVTLDITGAFVDVSAETSAVDEAVAAGGGPGMAPYWGGDGDDDYVLTVKGMGNALFTWKREKLMNDGNGSYTWYSYKRKGDAHPFERTGPNARVAKLRVQSYPYDSIEPGLLNWVDWEPAADFNGNEGSPITVSVTALGIGTGIAFADRDHYDVWRNADKPGSYWIQMDQGMFIDGGSRSAGYAVAWKAKQGTSGSQHDFQRVVFYYNADDYSCDEYDASDTCTPNGVDD